MKQLVSMVGALALTATIVTATTGSAAASSHREAPFLPRETATRPAVAPDGTAPAQTAAAPAPRTASHPLLIVPGFSPFLSALLFAWAEPRGLVPLRVR